MKTLLGVCCPTYGEECFREEIWRLVGSLVKELLLEPLYLSFCDLKINFNPKIDSGKGLGGKCALCPVDLA
jgi:hypothetical protein